MSFDKLCVIRITFNARTFVSHQTCSSQKEFLKDDSQEVCVFISARNSVWNFYSKERL